MAKYQEEVKVLLDAIGGKANIQAVSHLHDAHALCARGPQEGRRASH